MVRSMNEYEVKKLLSKNNLTHTNALRQLTIRMQKAQYLKTQVDGPSKGTKTVIFKDSNNTCFRVIYHYMSSEKIKEILGTTEGKIDLSGCYLDELTIDDRLTPLKSITARFAFILGRCKIESAKIEHDFTFNSTWFHGDARFVGISLKSNGSFRHSIFKSASQFRNIQCPENLDFQEAALIKSDFKKMSVTGSTIFKNCLFSADTQFSYCLFGKTDFRYASFLHSATFKITDFAKRADFTKALFKGAVNFSMVTFGEAAVFDSVSAALTINFHGFTCSNSISFKKATVNKITFIKIQFKEDSEFFFRQIGNLSFINCTIYCHLMLSLNQGQKSPTALFFNNVSNFGSIHMDWDINQVEDALKLGMARNSDGIDTNRKMNIERAQYLLLERNYRTLSQLTNEDRAIIARKRIERNYQRQPAKIIHFFLDIISEYGTNPVRCFLFGIVSIILFGIIYCLISYFQTDAFNITLGLINSMFYSGAAFITMAYGNIVALSPACRVLTTVEGFLGVFIAAYFTTILARKILR